jgi:23S rRNA pseudouridine955/2504/2580 synthase
MVSDFGILGAMSVEFITITDEQAGQRIDNFLITRFKGVPKTRIYRAVRKGEVRVNKKRVKAEYRIQEKDEIRLPPLKMAQQMPIMKPSDELAQFLEEQIIYEDKQCILINKPAGMPVHGGSNLSAGLIEMMRLMRPNERFLELVHRLDRETSGCLMLAKKRSFLLTLHKLLTERKVEKGYLALVCGKWQGDKRDIKEPLIKNTLKSGERMVKVDPTGRPAHTIVYPLQFFADCTLVLAKPVTGRTHQLRVHLAHIGHPILGDEKYGRQSANQSFRALGLRRLFLQSACFAFEHEGIRFGICLPLCEKLRDFVRKLDEKK